MLDLKALENEIRFFETLDAGVIAYKLLAEGELRSFEDGVRRLKNQIPLRNDVPYSRAVVANNIVVSSYMRRLFIMAIRESAKNIDFSNIANTKEYQELRDKLLNNDPSLTQVDCFKILRQFCNAVAHGDISRSFNFDDFDNIVTRSYKRKISCTSTNSQEEMTLSDVLKESSSLVLFYESNYEIQSDGTRVKRPAPVKHKVKLSLEDINDLLQLVIANDTTPDRTFYINDKFDVEVFDWTTNTREKYTLDEVQKDAIKEIRDDYLKFAKNVSISEKDKIYYGTMIGLERVLHGKNYIYLRADELIDSLTFLSPSINTNAKKKLKSTRQERSEYVSQFSQEALGHKFNSFRHQQYCYNADAKCVHKNLLMSQVTYLLGEVEQNALKVRTGKKSKIITEIATEFFDKKPEELIDKDYITIIDNIRDAFIHGSYINLPDDRTEIYDQISKSNKTLEHKFTIYNSDLEAIKDDCLEVFKDLRADMIRQSATVPANTPTNSSSSSNDKDFDK